MIKRREEKENGGKAGEGMLEEEKILNRNK